MVKLTLAHSEKWRVAKAKRMPKRLRNQHFAPTITSTLYFVRRCIGFDPGFCGQMLRIRYAHSTANNAFCPECTQKIKEDKKKGD